MPRSANERDLTSLMPSSTGMAADARELSRLASSFRVPEPQRAQGTLADMLDSIGGLGWSVIGFVVGAVFWHFIGFWSFVADVVLAGGPGAVGQGALRNAPQNWVRMADAEPVSDCTVLVLDRRSGVTSAGACPVDRAALPMTEDGRREDKLATGGPRSARR